MNIKAEEIPVGRAENLIGQQFSHLTVLYRVKDRQSRPTWQCQCDCGNYCTVLARDLKNGRAISCGCSKNENHIKDLSGQRFGKLVAIKMHDTRADDGTILWDCQCDCGNMAVVRASNLKKQKSCGKCFHGLDISGQRFGKLIALKYDHISESKRTIWKCLCDCGGISYVDITDLTSGKTQSCGCVKSRGEEKIAQILSEYNIPFIKQKSFDSCIFSSSGAKAIFDFFVDNRYIIEYDGIQHFEITGGWSTQNSFEQLKQRDIEKTIWCIKNNIPLLRIPYTKIDNLQIDDLRIETSPFLV